MDIASAEFITKAAIAAATIYSISQIIKIWADLAKFPLEYEQLQLENEELRLENKQLRKELDKT